MIRKLVFTAAGLAHYQELELNPAEAGTFKQVRKTLKLLEQDTRHPGLKTHEYDSLEGAAASGCGRRTLKIRRRGPTGCFSTTVPTRSSARSVCPS